MNIEATRAALLREARRQFTADGFSKAELGRIAAGAGVTTGAIYHHFQSKAGLFQAVVEEIETEILVIAASAPGADPLARLRAGFAILVGVCARPDVQRIIAVEAPQVLGPEAWREIELRYALGALREVLRALVEQRVIAAYSPDLVARVLLALLREVSAEMAAAGGDPEVERKTGRLVTAVLDGLFAPPADA